mmetsp:Transcript_148084/g.384821  ORF Transcript_148084/g.384821 Transcript_148084/m.384821 type:complete len:244 (+) Transcript_148084:792-1523(+)
MKAGEVLIGEMHISVGQAGVSAQSFVDPMQARVARKPLRDCKPATRKQVIDEQDGQERLQDLNSHVPTAPSKSLQCLLYRVEGAGHAAQPGEANEAAQLCYPQEAAGIGGAFDDASHCQDHAVGQNNNCIRQEPRLQISLRHNAPAHHQLAVCEEACVKAENDVPSPEGNDACHDPLEVPFDREVPSHSNGSRDNVVEQHEDTAEVMDHSDSGIRLQHPLARLRIFFGAKGRDGTHLQLQVED